MKSRYLTLLLVLSLSLQTLFAKKTTTHIWWNPSESEFNVVDGPVWPGKVEKRYDRLPASAKGSVRKPLWSFSDFK